MYLVRRKYFFQIQNFNTILDGVLFVQIVVNVSHIYGNQNITCKSIPEISLKPQGSEKRLFTDRKDYY